MVTGSSGLGPAISTHGGLRPHNLDCNFLLHSKMHQGGGVFDRLEFGHGRSRYEKSGEDHEHLFDLEIGMVSWFYQLELMTLKQQIAHDMDYKPADQRLGSVGLKLKSSPLLTKSIWHKTAAHRRLVCFCIFWHGQNRSRYNNLDAFWCVFGTRLGPCFDKILGILKAQPLKRQSLGHEV